MLRDLTLPVRSVDDFDELTIPFRAVATDIATGNKVVLGHGDLARALRASMAIPTAFSAVEIDGKLLVDGGVSDNVPVDVVREMGADVVIAIDIGSPLIAGNEVGRSYITILSQTLGFMTRANMAPQLAAADLVITPDVGGYGTLEFTAGREIIAKGETEARNLAEKLRPYALSEEDYRAWRASRQRELDPVPTVTAVRIEGNQRVDSRILENQVRLVPGSPYDPEAAGDDLSRIYGLGDFETVDAEFEPEGPGTALIYRVHEKPWGPTYLRFGFGFESNGRGDNDLFLLTSVNRRRINALGAEWKSDLQLGTDALVRTSFYQPLSFTRGWFVEPAYAYKRRNVPVFVDEERLAELEVREQDLQLDLGYSFGPFAEVRLGVDKASLRAQQETGVVPAELEHLLGERFERAGLTFSGIVDRLDSATLPKNGSYVKLTGFYSLDSLGADDSYAKYELRSSLYRTRSRRSNAASCAATTSAWCGSATTSAWASSCIWAVFSKRRPSPRCPRTC
jgi:NTE family protein